MTDEWLRAKFAVLNERHFAGSLPPPGAFMVWARTNASYAGYTQGLGASFIYVTREAFAKGEDFATDSLLHEMIYHAVFALYAEDHQNHGKRFVEIANRIAGELGLTSVGADSQEASVWPQTLRT